MDKNKKNLNNSKAKSAQYWAEQKDYEKAYFDMKIAYTQQTQRTRQLEDLLGDLLSDLADLTREMTDKVNL